MDVIARLNAELRQKIGERLSGLVRHLCIGLVDKGLVGFVLTAAAHGKIGDRIGCLLRGVFDIGVIVRHGVLRQLGRKVRQIIDTGFHIRLDLHVGVIRDRDDSGQQRVHHTASVRVIGFRQRFPVVIRIDCKRIAAQMAHAADLRLHAHDGAAILPHGADAVEVYVRDAGIPQIAAERTRIDG